MSKKNFCVLSWILWGLFSFSAILILVANFIFQMAIKADPKLTVAMNALFIIFNVIILAYLLILMVCNINDRKIDWTRPGNIGLWLFLTLYICFGISSSIAILNEGDAYYLLKAVTTMLSFIYALLLFPMMVYFLIKYNQAKKIISYSTIMVLIIYLLINLLLNFIIFLELTEEIAFLVTVTTMNLIFSIIFFGLLTQLSIKLYEKKNLNLKNQKDKISTSSY